MAGPDRDLQESLDGLETETWNADGADLDLRSTDELVELMNAQDQTVPGRRRRGRACDRGRDRRDRRPAARRRPPDLRRRRDLGPARRARRGRVRGDLLRARPGQVTALIAGGTGGSPLEQEAAEDDAAAGERELEALGVSAADAVVAISASGRTPYVLGALAAAASAGALTVCLVSSATRSSRGSPVTRSPSPSAPRSSPARRGSRQGRARSSC